MLCPASNSRFVPIADSVSTRATTQRDAQRLAQFTKSLLRNPLGGLATASTFSIPRGQFPHLELQCGS
jgi:hypothetical protein